MIFAVIWILGVLSLFVAAMVHLVDETDDPIELAFLSILAFLLAVIAWPVVWIALGLAYVITKVRS